MSNLRVVHPENLFVEHVNSLKDPDNFVKSFQNIINITTETKSQVLYELSYLYRKKVSLRQEVPQRDKYYIRNLNFRGYYRDFGLSSYPLCF